MIKKLIPSGKKLALGAAEKIQAAFNGTEADKRAVVARWASLAEDVTAVPTRLAAMLKDGTLDDDETAELATMIEPLMSKVREAI